MLVLLLLTLWTADGDTKVIAKELPTLEICKKYAKEVVKLARKDEVDLSASCVVVRRPIGI